jgi:hypothetical protein
MRGQDFVPRNQTAVSEELHARVASFPWRWGKCRVGANMGAESFRVLPLDDQD